MFLESYDILIIITHHEKPLTGRADLPDHITPDDCPVYKCVIYFRQRLGRMYLSFCPKADIRAAQSYQGEFRLTDIRYQVFQHIWFIVRIVVQYPEIIK